MQNQVERLLTSLPASHPPADLLFRVENAIQDRMRIRSAVRRMVATVAGLVALVGGTFIYWGALMSELAQSSFASYVRVLMTDSDVMVTHWQEVGMSLLESLPMANVMVWSLMAFLVCGLAYAILQIKPHAITRHGSLTA